MFKRILWMHDLSERADRCLPTLLALARRDDAFVAIGHALGAPVAGHDEHDDPALTQRRHDAVPLLATRQASLEAAGVAAEVHLRAGQPAEVAEGIVVLEAIDLVIIGATGATGLDRVLLGSNAARLVRHLSVPVLVVRGRPMGDARRVLQPVDLDSPNADAMRFAATLARHLEAHLDYVAIVEPVLDAPQPAVARDDLLKDLHDAVGDEFPPSWGAEVVVAETPVEGICADAERYDLVIMATHGRTGWRRVLLGSVSESVVEACPVSVLVTR